MYPVFIKLSGRLAVVAGGGSVAALKVRALLEAGARVKIVSPKLDPELAALAAQGALEWVPRKFAASDLEGAWLAIAATADPQASRQVFEEAEKRRLIVNAVDQEDCCIFHAPATVTRGDLKIAISTAGKSPAFAARLKERIEGVLSAADADFVSWLGRLRARVLEKFAGEPERRRKIFQALVQAFRLPAGGTANPAARPPAPAFRAARPGRVYLVGAGPGDPGLLTLRAAALLLTADAVYYDRLIGPGVLEWISAAAEKVYVGKEAGEPPAVNTGELLAGAARQGKAVVRLKGGDPNIFGRGGDEMAALLKAGVDFEVVPGVSALAAVPAAAGIPITYRGLSHQVVVRSGYRNSDPAAARLVPPTPAESTYVYFMTVGRLAEIVAELLEEDGLAPSTPIAIIQRGTLPEQEVLLGTLGDILERAERAPLRPPALVVAGETVRFARRDQILDFLKSGNLSAKISPPDPSPFQNNQTKEPLSHDRSDEWRF